MSEPNDHDPSDGWPMRVCMTCGCVRLINPETNMCRECDENLSEAEDNS